MASYGTDLQVFNLADDDTGWAELTGHTTASAPAQSTENFYHNGISIDQATGQALGDNGGMQWDNGADVVWTSGWVFVAWQKFDAGTNIFGWALGGMRFGIGSSAGNMRYWNTIGDDFRNYPSGGWQSSAVDPEVAGDGVEDGTPVVGSYRIIGSNPNMRAKISKGSPHVVDVIRYGRGEITAIGTGGTFADMALANDATTARWGLFAKKGNAYEWMGLMSLGTTASSLTMTDSDVVINIVDSPRVSAGFNKIEINHLSTVLNLSKVTFNGIKLSITGLAPISRGDLEAVDNATLTLNAWTFNDMGTFIWQSNQTLNEFTYKNCGLVTQGGCTMVNPTFDIPLGTGLLADNINLITGGKFTSTGTGYAVDLGNFSADASLAWDINHSGYSLSNGTTDSTILIDVDAGFTVTINVSATGDAPTFNNVGLGAVIIVENLVTLTVTGHPVGSTVILYDLDSGNTEELGTRLATFQPASANEIYQYAGGKAGDTIQVKMIMPNYRTYSQIYTLGAGDALYTINAEEETN